MTNYTEDTLELSILEYLSELGYETLYGPDIAFDGKNPERKQEDNYRDVVLVERLRRAVAKINPNIPNEAREEAIRKVVNVPLSTPDLLESNYQFHKMLRDGIDVEGQRADGTPTTHTIWLIDKKRAENNEFLAMNQYTIIEKRNRRPDVIIFINGMPIVLFELKNPTDEKATVKSAYNQIQTYKKDIPSLFTYNEICIISDGQDARAGSLTADIGRYMRWRSKDGEELAPKESFQVKILTEGLLNKKTLIDYIYNFITFEQGKKETVKKVAAYHQYYATNKAIMRTLAAADEKIGDQKCGVVWHTQGSGKSLTMVFYAGKLIQKLDNPTLVVITDRNDLDDQLFGTFSKSKDLLRQVPKHATDRMNLRELLKVASGGVVFTTIHKFMLGKNGVMMDPLLSDRHNIVVIADEAHRSQYGFLTGLAKALREALPNASFIGFTGTPIAMAGKDTQAVFGDYIDVYDITTAVDDEATVPIYYEPRLAKIKLDEDKVPRLDEEVEEVMEGQEMTERQKTKSKWARLEAMVGTKERLELVAKDIVSHFEQRQKAMKGKALIVTMSRRIAVDLHDEITKLKPEWHNPNLDRGAIKVVMTGSASDPANFQSHLTNKKEREDLAKRIKDPNDELKIAIVCDMWLTGFDVPCLHTMYLDKPMKNHGLMQAIARVNRTYSDGELQKKGGLIVDYLGVAQELKKSLEYYSSSDQKNTAIPQEVADNILLEKLEVVGQMYHGFDYSEYQYAKPSRKTELLNDATNFILGLDDGKKRYLKNTKELSQAFAIAVPSDIALKHSSKISFFKDVAGMISKFDQDTHTKTTVTPTDYDELMKQLISGAVIADGQVVPIYNKAGLETPEISILSEEFLNDVKDMKHKNIAMEILKKLLNDEIKSLRSLNLVKSKSFSEMLQETIRKYQNRSIEAAEVILELIAIAKELEKEKGRSKELGLSVEEIAFYDALAKNESAVRELGDETLRKIAQEIASTIQKSISIDWEKKEGVRAKLRLLVKRALKKYNYPPDKQEAATRVVLSQAEQMSERWVQEKLV